MSTFMPIRGKGGINYCCFDLANDSGKPGSKLDLLLGVGRVHVMLESDIDIECSTYDMI